MESARLMEGIKAIKSGTFSFTFTIYQMEEIKYIIYKDIVSTEVMPVKGLEQRQPLSK